MGYMPAELIRLELKNLADPAYREFQSKLVPNVEPATILGVRVPALRRYARELSRKPDLKVKFLSDLPHTYYDENLLHAILLSSYKDYEGCLKAVNQFLPYVDNWAVCDSLSPGLFKAHRDDLPVQIEQWIAAPDRVYTCRFGLKMLMTHFLDEDFKPAYLEQAAAVRAEDYYLKMMQAWFFATALAKQWKAALPYIEKKKTSSWVYRKIIQKACESLRLTDEQKAYLRRLRI